MTIMPKTETEGQIKGFHIFSYFLLDSRECGMIVPEKFCWGLRIRISSRVRQSSCQQIFLCKI